MLRESMSMKTTAVTCLVTAIVLSAARVAVAQSKSARAFVSDAEYNVAAGGQGLALFDTPRLLTPVGALDLTRTGVLWNVDLGVGLLHWSVLYGALSSQSIPGANLPTPAFGGTLAIAGKAGDVFALTRTREGATQLAVRIFGGARTGRNITVLPLVLGDKGPNDGLNGVVAKYVPTPPRTSTFGLTLRWAE
jgi:hypothetical protein